MASSGVRWWMAQLGSLLLLLPQHRLEYVVCVRSRVGKTPKCLSYALHGGPADPELVGTVSTDKLESIASSGAGCQVCGRGRWQSLPSRAVLNDALQPLFLTPSQWRSTKPSKGILWLEPSNSQVAPSST
eukprot:4418346-Amphidinium_carterae.2